MNFNTPVVSEAPPETIATSAQPAARTAFWVVAVSLGALLLYLSLRGVEWRRVGEIIGGADWFFLLLAAGTMCLTFFLRALRWRIVLNAKARLPLRGVFSANMLGYLGNNFLPARAGEVLRSVLISRISSLSKTYVLTTAISERLLDVVALVLWSSLILITVESKPAWMAQLSRVTALGAAAGALIIVILPHTGVWLERLLVRFPAPERLRLRLLGFGREVLLGVAAFHNVPRLLYFVVCTAMIWLTDAVGLVFLAWALDLDVSLSVAVLLLTGIGLASSLPSTPGYVGVHQFVSVTVLAGFGVVREAALAYSVVLQVTGYIVICVLGLPSIRHFRTSRHP
jgi:uncharacterized protein (TIRG00374 family)